MNMRSIALENINPEIISQRQPLQPQSKWIMGLRYDLYKNEIHSFNSQQEWHRMYYAAVAIRQLVLWNNSLWFPSTNEFSALPRRALRKAHQAMRCNGKPQARSWPFTAGLFTLLLNSPGKKDQVSLKVHMTLQSLLIATLQKCIED